MVEDIIHKGASPVQFELVLLSYNQQKLSNMATSLLGPGFVCLRPREKAHTLKEKSLLLTC